MGLVTELVGKIKRRMKQRGITYKDMAKKIGVSEASLKRSFSKHLFTIERVEEICTHLNLSLEELGKSETFSFHVDVLSDEQETFFASDEEAFVIFYLLVSGFHSKSIQKHFVFSAKKLRSVLLRMDKLGLIKLFQDDRVVTCVGQGIWWKSDGPLNLKYGALIRSDFIKSKFNELHERAWLTAGNLSPASLSTLQKKQDKIIAEFKDLVELDKGLPIQDKVNVTFFSGIRPWTLPPILKYRKKRSLT